MRLRRRRTGHRLDDDGGDEDDADEWQHTEEVVHRGVNGVPIAGDASAEDQATGDEKQREPQARRAIAVNGHGIAALGQMLVVMTGGIDLSTPATLTLSAMIMVGVG